MTYDLTPAKINRIKRSLPDVDTANPIAAIINYFKHQLRLDLDYVSEEDSSSGHTISVKIFGVTIAKASS